MSRKCKDKSRKMDCAGARSAAQPDRSAVGRLTGLAGAASAASGCRAGISKISIAMNAGEYIYHDERAGVAGADSRGGTRGACTAAGAAQAGDGKPAVAAGRSLQVLRHCGQYAAQGD